MERRRTRKYTSLAQINLTNLVDISLVLLIVFILTAPVMKEGIEVNTPQAETADQLSRTEEPIVVTITREKQILVDEEPYTEETVGERVRMAFAQSPRAVFLKGDGALSYEYVLGIFDRIRQAGVERVTLVTRPPETRGADPS